MAYELRVRYGPIEPNRSGYLAVSPLHSMYWEESGNANGQPILFLHGGPGSGTDPSHRCFFDPAAYRIILFDQRGCGKSRPHAELKENTTWDLVQDIEKLRKHLDVAAWIVFGGSWGSTLALAYAETCPAMVKGLILRGIFLCRPSDLEWFYQSGASYIFPDEWEKFVDPIPQSERKNLIKAYYKRLTSSDPQEQITAARAWAGWEGATLNLRFNASMFQAFTQDSRAGAIARIESHYFIHGGFFKTKNWLIENIDAIRQIPAILVHGRYDVICPFESAWALHQAWPEAKLEIIPDAGHSAGEPGIADALIRATDAFRRRSDVNG
ncbi:MAG: prolyl aminopeptidase [Parachlamydiales bacterium]|nr:prolyl aminopeptidase [Parachlamydiales bacterium]